MPNKWLEHVAQYRKAHPSIKSYKEVLKRAKATYKKENMSQNTQTGGMMRSTSLPGNTRVLFRGRDAVRELRRICYRIYREYRNSPAYVDTVNPTEFINWE